jgi:BirA family transcriptional regulator, biotin operon repressor / biotin---[acetyl-CoA-carboxylase] ligase
VIDAGEQFPDGPPRGKLATSGGSDLHEVKERGGEVPDGPPRGKLAPVGGSVHTKWESVGAILEKVAPVLPGFTVEILPEIDSTNSELMRRARSGQTEPTLLVAEHQTAGRGRLGRTWHDDGDRASPTVLMFSLGLALAPADWSGLSLAVGASVAQSLHPELRLKWPNDIWWQERKLAGILIETVASAAAPLSAGGADNRARYAVIGIGINIAPRTGEGLSTPPAWLQELVPGLDAAAALQRVIEPLVRLIQRFEKSGFAPFQAGFNRLDALAGRTVAASDGASGTGRGVDETGALVLQTTAGVVKITSSEVSVRPQGNTGFAT